MKNKKLFSGKPLLSLGLSVLALFVFSACTQEQSQNQNQNQQTTTNTNGSVASNDNTEMAEDGTDEVDVVFDLSGENFKFLMDGVEAPELKVKVGDRVRINFQSADGFHDWVVDEFDAATDRVSTGDSTSVEFVADEAGNYEYYCSVGQHRANGMFGSLVVEQ